MNRRIPPLNALRAFEAAARHLSFTRAADELNVTQAAVSHQVKALEERLGIPLFKRLNRALILTESGQLYYPPLRDALDAIESATRMVEQKTQAGRRVLTVSVMPSFASLWLVPRIPNFRESFPDIDLRIDADDKKVNFAEDDVDVAVRYGKGNWQGVHAELLMTDEVFPICSPGLLEGEKPLREPSDLKHHNLLHDQVPSSEVTHYWDWANWLKAAGADGVDPDRGTRFSHLHMVVQAAIAGEGVALGRSSMNKVDLDAGRLVRPFEDSVPSPWSFYFVCAESSKDVPKVKLFRDWLFAECDAVSGG